MRHLDASATERARLDQPAEHRRGHERVAPRQPLDHLAPPPRARAPAIDSASPRTSSAREGRERHVGRSGRRRRRLGAGTSSERNAATTRSRPPGPALRASPVRPALPVSEQLQRHFVGPLAVVEQDQGRPLGRPKRIEQARSRAWRLRISPNDSGPSSRSSPRRAPRPTRAVRRRRPRPGRRAAPGASRPGRARRAPPRAGRVPRRSALRRGAGQPGRALGRGAPARRAARRSVPARRAAASCRRPIAPRAATGRPVPCPARPSWASSDRSSSPRPTNDGSVSVLGGRAGRPRSPAPRRLGRAPRRSRRDRPGPIPPTGSGRGDPGTGAAEWPRPGRAATRP